MFSTVLAFLVMAGLFLAFVILFMTTILIVGGAYVSMYHVFWHVRFKLTEKSRQRKSKEKALQKIYEGCFLMSCKEITEAMQKSSAKSQGASWQIEDSGGRVAFFKATFDNKPVGWAFDVYDYAQNPGGTAKSFYGFKTLKAAVQACKDYGYVSQSSKPKKRAGVLHMLGEHISICYRKERGIKLYIGYGHPLEYKFSTKQHDQKEFKTHLEAVEFLVGFLKEYSFLELEDWVWSKPMEQPSFFEETKLEDYVQKEKVSV